MIVIICDNCGHEYDIDDWDELDPNCPQCFAEHLKEAYRDDIYTEGFTYDMLGE